MKPATAGAQDLPLKMVGGSNFGRDPKISLEESWNLIVSDNFMVPYAGSKSIVSAIPGGAGRAIYSSIKDDHFVSVIDNKVFYTNKNTDTSQIGELVSFTGDVFLSENNGGQIAICDRLNIYIFDYVLNTFQKATIDFLPGFITFQQGFFISVDISGTNQWRLSDTNNGLSWPSDAFHVGEFQSKANKILAAAPVPGQSNLLFVFGQSVTEAWYLTGAQLFPYQKSTYFDIQFGCLNASTIKWNQTFVVWLGGNEKSTPQIVFSNGSAAQIVKNDGVNYKLASLKKPNDSYGVLLNQDGHIIYQLTFPFDNVSFAYDFTEQKIYNVSDHKQDYHKARQSCFFNNTYFYVSFVDGNIYEWNSKYNDENGLAIPRIRIIPPIRLADGSKFSVNSLAFPIEQGNSQALQSIDLAMSTDGAESFGSFLKTPLNLIGNRKNRFTLFRLGTANDLTFQFRFWGSGRYVFTDGVLSIYQ